jgi:hypothetical protein
MKQVLISAVVTRWVEVADDATEHSVFYQTADIFAGIDGAVWDITDTAIIDEDIG